MGMDWTLKEDGEEGGVLGWLWCFGLYHLGGRWCYPGDWNIEGDTDFPRRMLDLVLNTAVSGISRVLSK